MNILYTATSANGQRASVALQECGIDYEARLVDLAGGEHHSEELLRLNPFARIPFLQLDDGTTIYSSMAVAMYAARQSGKFLPPDEDLDAMYHWLGIIMTDLTPSFAGKFYLGVLSPEKCDWGVEFYTGVIQRYLAAIDAHLADSEYFLPSGISVVDLLFYPTAATSLASLPEAADTYPNISRWASLVGAREAVQRGMAPPA